MYLSEKQEQQNTPIDRLLSLKYEEYQTSQYCKPDHYMRVNHVDERRYAAVVRAILTHGLYPNHGAGQDEPQASNNNKYMAKNYEQDTPLVDLINKCVLRVKTDNTIAKQQLAK